MTEQDRNMTSWISALGGLRILAEQNEKLYKDTDELEIILRARLTKEEKEKIKKAMDFISKVLDTEVKIKRKGLFK